MTNQTHYDILKVTQDAPIEVIKAAHKALSKIRHPDKNPRNLEEANRIMKDINNAFDNLKDREKRAKYDSSISKQEANSSTHSKAKNMPNPIDKFDNTNDRLANLEEAYITIEKKMNYILAMHEEAVPKPRKAETPRHPAVDPFACANEPEKLKSWL